MANDKVLATVGSLTVTQDEVNEMLVSLMQRGQNYNNPQGIDMVVEQLIGKKLLIHDAQKNHYEYNQDFKAQLEKIKEELLANYSVQKTMENVTVSDDEVKKYYEEHKAEFKKGESVDASHILVDTEEKANEILNKINGNEISFEDAARQHSSCPSGQNGGTLGKFTRGQMVPEFDEAVFNMSKGEIKGPVKTQFGYHIIKVNAKNGAKEMEFEEVKEQIKEMVLREKQQKAYESKINQLKILYPVTKM